MTCVRAERDHEHMTYKQAPGLFAGQCANVGCPHVNHGGGVEAIDGRRGFIQAGAKNLLLTLWPIDDAEIEGYAGFLRCHDTRAGAPPAHWPKCSARGSEDCAAKEAQRKLA